MGIQRLTASHYLGDNMKVPRFQLVVEKRNPTHPFEIVENVPAEINGYPGWNYKIYRSFRTFDEAIVQMAVLSTGPIVLATSSQSMETE